jgi:hypothetical protein
LADVDSLPVELRVIARRIDGGTVAVMSQMELQLRCEYVLELQSRAASEPPDKAERTRKLAERVVCSLSDYTFSEEQAKLSGRISAAQLEGDNRAAADAWRELNGLRARHPRVPAERVMGHAVAVVAKVAEDRLKLPPPVSSRLFGRRNTRNRGRR